MGCDGGILGIGMNRCVWLVIVLVILFFFGCRWDD
jgi:hypothetical protein